MFLASGRGRGPQPVTGPHRASRRACHHEATDALHRPPAAARRPLRVLVVCTGNSARSILGEALLRHLGGGRRRGPLGGHAPEGRQPAARCASSQEAGIATDGLESKSVTAYLGEAFDYVITVCDDAREACPVFPGAREHDALGLPGPGRGRGHGGRARSRRSVRCCTASRHRVRAFPPLAERTLRQRTYDGARMITLYPPPPRARRRPRALDRRRRACGRCPTRGGASPSGSATCSPPRTRPRTCSSRRPRSRAAETARIVAAALGVPVVVDRRLVGPLYAEEVADILAAAGPAERPCIVGHDPDFSSLLGELIGVSVVPMRKGGRRPRRLRGTGAQRARDAAVPRAAGAPRRALSAAPGARAAAAQPPGSAQPRPRPAHRLRHGPARDHDVRDAVEPVGRPRLGLHADRVLRHRVDDPPRAGRADPEPQLARPLEDRVRGEVRERVVPRARRSAAPARRSGSRRARGPASTPGWKASATGSAPSARTRRNHGCQPITAGIGSSASSVSVTSRPVLVRARSAGARARGTASARRGRWRWCRPTPPSTAGRTRRRGSRAEPS